MNDISICDLLQQSFRHINIGSFFINIYGNKYQGENVIEMTAKLCDLFSYTLIQRQSAERNEIP